MTDRDMQQPSEHEQEVLDEQRQPSDRTDKGGLVGTTEPAPAETGATSYEQEIEAERRGMSADELEEEVREDERTPLDSAYRPRSG